MRRREFVTGLAGAVARPLPVRAQQGERMRRVGVLSYGAETGVGATPIRKVLGHELQKLGWIEGRSLLLDFRFGNGDATQTRLFAADLVRLAPNVIVTAYFVALRALQQQTQTIPIVFTGAGDPVEGGTVINSARSEGNITGFANRFGSLGSKWLELLKEVAPNVARVAYMYPIGNVGAGYQPVETAARSLGVRVVRLPVSDVAAIKAAIAAFAAEPNGGLLASPAMSAIAPDELIGLAAQYRLPAVYGDAYFSAVGGMMSYDSDSTERYRGAASYVDRLLRGAKVSDLPVQYPTKFRLVINLKTAKALGLTIPESFLLRADEVIE